MHKTIDFSDITFFTSLLGDRCLTDIDILREYGHDETEDFVFPADVVLKPETVEEVSKIMKFY